MSRIVLRSWCEVNKQDISTTKMPRQSLLIWKASLLINKYCSCVSLRFDIQGYHKLTQRSLHSLCVQAFFFFSIRLQPCPAPTRLTSAHWRHDTAEMKQTGCRKAIAVNYLECSEACQYFFGLEVPDFHLTLKMKNRKYHGCTPLQTVKVVLAMSTVAYFNKVRISSTKHTSSIDCTKHFK